MRVCVCAHIGVYERLSWVTIGLKQWNVHMFLGIHDLYMFYKLKMLGQLFQAERRITFFKCIHVLNYVLLSLRNNNGLI